MSDVHPALSASLERERPTAGLRLRLPFFSAMAIVMLVLVFLGFAGSFYLRGFLAPPGSTPPTLPPHLYLHGVVLTGWYVWFAVQTLCVATGRTALHRRLGIAGAMLGVAVIVAAALTSLRFWPRMTEIGVAIDPQLVSEIVWLNAAFLICFVAFLASGIALRGRPQLHKRLMLLASLSILPPAVTRILDWPIWGLGADAYFALFCAQTVPLVALAVYDLKSRGAVHPLTLAGSAAILGTYVLGGFVLPNTEFGSAAVVALYELMRD
jgi:hypothetical protein